MLPVLGLYGSDVFHSFPSQPGTRVFGQYNLNCPFQGKFFFQNLYIFICIAEEFKIFKTEVNLLNLPEDPCDETDSKVDIEQCIKDEVEKRLKCTIPNLSSGEPIAPDEMLTNSLCSSNHDFKNYTQFYGRLYLYPTESAIAKELGCIATCQEGKRLE